MDRVPDCEWVPDRVGVPGEVPIWLPRPSDSTGWHETLKSQQSEILHSSIFDLLPVCELIIQ